MKYKWSNIVIIAFKVLLITIFATLANCKDTIYRVEIKTSDCDDCGMSNTFGALRMQVCFYTVCIHDFPSSYYYDYI